MTLNIHSIHMNGAFVNRKLIKSTVLAFSKVKRRKQKENSELTF